MTLTVTRRSAKQRWLARCAALAALFFLACADELDGTIPPQDVLYFPIGLELSEDQSIAYVVNSNFDRRFNTGWLTVFDLVQVERALDAAAGGVIDLVDDKDNENPNDDETFGGLVQQLAVPTLGGSISRSPGGLFYIAHRSDRVISILEPGAPNRDSEREREIASLEPRVRSALLNCGENPNVNAGLTIDERRTDCDCFHLYEFEVERVEEASATDSLDELDVADPFSLRVADVDLGSGPARYLLAGQLTRARLNALELDENPNLDAPNLDCEDPTFLRLGDVPILTDQGDQIIDDNDNVVTENYGRSELLANSGRFNSIVLPPIPGRAYLAAVGIIRSNGADRSGLVHVDLEVFLNGDNLFGTPFAIGQEVGGREFAAMAFSPDGTLAFGASRLNVRTSGDSARGSVIRMDASLRTLDFINPAGERDSSIQPLYDVDAQTALRGQPSGILYFARPGQSDLLIVVDLDQDALYVLDPQSSEMPVIGRVDVPGGPFTIQGATVNGRSLVLATLFYDHGLAVVDVSSEDPIDFALAAVLRDVGRTAIQPGERAR